MLSLKQILLDFVIVIVTVMTIIYVYQNYGSQILVGLFGEQVETIFIENLALTVTLADTDEKRRQGLSGVQSLDELEGKLFIFDTEDYHGIWMKDMLFPIDIIWINNEYSVVHIAKNVTPDSYPTTYTSDEPARFVLEMNSFFSNSYQIKEGDFVTIPAAELPDDLRTSIRL